MGLNSAGVRVLYFPSRFERGEDELLGTMPSAILEDVWWTAVASHVTTRDTRAKTGWMRPLLIVSHVLLLCRWLLRPRAPNPNTSPC